MNAGNATAEPGSPQDQQGGVEREAMRGEAPTVRLHLWLERGGELYFGMGRAQLLVSVGRLGSIKKAAESMGMSYRAAWGKLQQSERALGVKLVESRGARCSGVRLTPEALALVAAFEAWFAAVERAALEAAQRLLPFPAAAFGPECAPEGEAAEDQCQSSNMLKITY
jgi:molybdate transport system regulatory protein